MNLANANMKPPSSIKIMAFQIRKLNLKNKKGTAPCLFAPNLLTTLSLTPSPIPSSPSLISRLNF